MKVVGLDLSLTGSGIASTAGWCERVGLDGVTRLPLDARIDAVDSLRVSILNLLDAPDLAVIEGQSFNSRGGGTVERNALWWWIVRAMRRRDVPVAIASPYSRALYATGQGHAPKTAVVAAVTRRWPQYDTGGDDNCCDAVVLAAMGADWLGEPLCPMPASHRRALEKVAWPEVAR